MCSPLENKEGVHYILGIIRVVALKRQLIYSYEENSLLKKIIEDFKNLC